MRDTEGQIAAAVACLRRGGLVAFPTETVYGLGADAEQPEAVARLFAAKQRPAWHPVIVHGADSGVLDRYADDPGEAARHLASAFWPGPLTLVLRRSRRVSDAISGGQDTVGLRVPDHPVALALLEAFGGGVAAPSANRFGRVSPTSAADVRAELGDAVDMVLDGGRADVGIESTVLDLSADRPTILRPGAVSSEAIAKVLGHPVWRVAGSGRPRAPGTLATHYAPAARVEIATQEELAARASELAASGHRVAIIAPEPVALPESVVCVSALGDPREYARGLYRALRASDAAGADTVLAVPPLGGGLAEAIADRLERAARSS